MTNVLAFGKHRGKTFQQTFDEDKSYVKWVMGLPETAGQMKAFVDFCREQESVVSATHPVRATQPAQAPPQIAQTPAVGSAMVQTGIAAAQKFPLVIELCAAATIQVGPSKAGAYVPQPIWQELCRLPGAIIGDCKKVWRFPLNQYDSLVDSIRAHPVLGFCELELIPAWLLKAIESVRKVVQTESVKANEWLAKFIEDMPDNEQLDGKTLMEFQKEGICFGLSRGGRCLIGDEMGLGKTVQALVIAAQYIDEWPVLVVVPSALRCVWRDQSKMWLGHLLQGAAVQMIELGKDNVRDDARIVIVSYDMLSRNPKFMKTSSAGHYRVVIVDEAHYIKDPSTKRSKAILELSVNASRCLLLTGTPAVNRACELYTQLKVLLPSWTGYYRYCERYCEKQEWGPQKAVRWVGAKRKSELNAFLVETVMVRRLKQDVLKQLPRKRRQRITLDPSKFDKTKMKEIGRFLNPSEPILFESMEDEAVPELVPAVFKLTAEAKVAAVIDYCECLLEADLKFLVFAHHHVMLDGIEHKLRESKTGYIRIDGKTAQNKRGELVETFQTDVNTRVAVLGITSAGAGLTLTAAHTVVFAELYWVPGQMMQAEDRVHRIGQEHSVDVHYCIAEGSFDDRLFLALNRKCRDVSGMLDGNEHGLDAWNTRSAVNSDTAAGDGIGVAGCKRTCPEDGSVITKYFKLGEKTSP